MTTIEAEIEQIKNQLLGAVITRTVTDTDQESFGFEVKTKYGKTLTVWVDCDPEGNGPGHLNIE